MHELQCDKHLSWDTPLNDKLLNEWKNIVNQANSSSPIEIPRKMGKRTDQYRLIACTDSSTKIYGVVYAHNLNTNELNSFSLKTESLVVRLNQRLFHRLNYRLLL